MQIEDFAGILARHGIRDGAGVPCSYFTPLVDHMGLDPHMRYVGAASEGEAVAIAAGLTAAGRPAFALMQNSGLGNAVNPITSMLDVFGIPVVLLVSHRGRPGSPDEPQHTRMGAITEQLARLCGLPTRTFDDARFESQLAEAQADGGPSAFIFPKGSLHGGLQARPTPITVEVGEAAPPRSGRLQAKASREAVLDALLPLFEGQGQGQGQGIPRAAVVATTGKLSRELFELGDRDHGRDNRFYMVGSMGCAAGFGLGVALGQPGRPVIVLDGDGALLMKLGTLATIGALRPDNLHHVVIDNGAHDSTGAQPTVSPTVDFEAVARACGYRNARSVDDPAAARDALAEQLSAAGPSLLRVLVRAGARPGLGRPTLDPKANFQRFRTFLATGVPT